MPVVSHSFSLPMKGETQIENITAQVQNKLTQSKLQAGIITIFVRHTTASVFIIEDEPGLRVDTKTFWDQLIPPLSAWKHNVMNPGEDNGHSHLRGQVQGSSLTIPFNEYQLSLGKWQQIGIVDFDTKPRTREILVQIMGE